MPSRLFGAPRGDIAGTDGGGGGGGSIGGGGGAIGGGGGMAELPVPLLPPIGPIANGSDDGTDEEPAGGGGGGATGI